MIWSAFFVLRLTLMYQNFTALAHELCPVQLLEVTKKSDILSGLLAIIQHLAHIQPIPHYPLLNIHIVCCNYVFLCPS